jgi:UDP-N-acetylglucosamine 4,6-dehydratase (inverting)
MNWQNSVVLVTGGTGSFGKRFTDIMVRECHPRKLIIFSRDELKQFEMQRDWHGPEMRYFLGDVRDRDRLMRALEGVDTVVHAAALKQVPAAEYNPMEFIKTNVLGAENVIEACIDTGVKRVVALSTDKACSPINLYGATKLCSDKLFIAANNIRGRHNIRFSVVRYGNVMGSRGSVIPFFMEQRHTGKLPITDPRMTRFNITLDEGVGMVLHALEHALGGEIFVPKIPSYRIVDVAEAIGPKCEKPVIGIRPGEKIHEEMVTETDAPQTIVTDKHYIIVPMRPRKDQQKVMTEYCKKHNGEPVPEGFCYNSGRNTEWLNVEQIRALIREHVDGSFPI